MAQDWFSYAFFIYSQPSFLLEITILAITCVLMFKIFLQMNQIYYKVLERYEKMYMEAQAEPDEEPRVNNSGEIRRRLHKLIKDGSKGIYNEEEKNEVKKLIYEDLSSKKLLLKDEKKSKNGVKGDSSKYQNKVKKRLKTIIDGIDTGAKWRKILDCIPVKEIEAIEETTHPETNMVKDFKGDPSKDRKLLFTTTKKEVPREDLAKRVEKFLSTTPSEYVRKDVERMKKERTQKEPTRNDFREICYEKKAIERFKFYRDND